MNYDEMLRGCLDLSGILCSFEKEGNEKMRPASLGSVENSCYRRRRRSKMKILHPSIHRCMETRIFTIVLPSFAFLLTQNFGRRKRKKESKSNQSINEQLFIQKEIDLSHPPLSIPTHCTATSIQHHDG